MSKNVAAESAWPTLNKESNESKCQTIFWNLLKTLESKAPGDAVLTFLAQTSRCDHVHDLSAVRKAHEKYIGTPVLKEVLSYSVDPVVEKKANSTVGWYAAWTDRELYTALTWPNKLYYNTVHRFDRFAAGSSLIGACVAGAGGLYVRYKLKGK